MIFQLLISSPCGTCFEGFNFKPQGDTVEIEFWSLDQGGPESGPIASSSSRSVSLSEARAFYREAVAEGYQPQ